MRWQASKYSRDDITKRWKDCREEWHAKFAFLPVILDEEKFDEIIVPRCWVWLERYSFRYYWARPTWTHQRRTYRGEPSLRELVRR